MCRPCRRARSEALVRSPSRAATRLTSRFEGGEDREMFRAAHVLRQPEQPGGNPQAVGVRGAESKIHPARRCLRPGARCGPFPLSVSAPAAAKSSCSTSSVPPWSAKRASSLPAGMSGNRSSPTRKVTRMSSPRRCFKRSCPIAAASSVAVAPDRHCRLSLRCCRWRCISLRASEPGRPQRPFADHLAQIEPVAVEINLDQAALSALQAQAAAELGPAQLARRIGKLELAVADDRHSP